MPAGHELPLRAGDSGEAVRELQERLSGLGVVIDDEPGRFGPSTEAALVEFQQRRGLAADGVCDRYTWATVVEAAFRLGDRLLFEARPMLRGDDVSDLQQRLGALGFDAGWADGICGELTTRALADFQRNAGQVVDGICGPATLAALERLGRRDGQHLEPVPVTEVRERETLRRAPRTLVGRRIAVAHAGGLERLVDDLAQTVAGKGATGVPLVMPDAEDQAESANLLGADVFLGFEVGEEGVSSCYWALPSGANSSPGGRHLAQLLSELLPEVLGLPDLGSHGRSFPVLRRTQMPAVVCRLGPVEVVLDRSYQVAGAVGAALERWASTPC